MEPKEDESVGWVEGKKEQGSVGRPSGLKVWVYFRKQGEPLSDELGE